MSEHGEAGEHHPRSSGLHQRAPQHRAALRPSRGLLQKSRYYAERKRAQREAPVAPASYYDATYRGGNSKHIKRLKNIVSG